MEQLLLISVRRAWHTVRRRSGRSLMAMPSVRAMPLNDAIRSTGPVQKPGSIVQIWNSELKSASLDFFVKQDSTFWMNSLKKHLMSLVLTGLVLLYHRTILYIFHKPFIGLHPSVSPSTSFITLLMLDQGLIFFLSLSFWCVSAGFFFLLNASCSSPLHCCKTPFISLVP